MNISFVTSDLNLTTELEPICMLCSMKYAYAMQTNKNRNLKINERSKYKNIVHILIIIISPFTYETFKCFRFNRFVLCETKIYRWRSMNEASSHHLHCNCQHYRLASSSIDLHI